MDFNLHNFLPAVFLKVITVLENGNEPVSWTLSRSGTGQFSLSVKSPAIVKDRVNFTQRPQDTGKAVPERSTSKKKKTPARARRDRRRWTKWYHKKNSGTSAPKPVESRPLVPEPNQLESSQEVLESPKTKQDNISANAIHLEQPVCLEQEVSSCSEIDSDDDVNEPVFEPPNFCATCYVGPPAVTLKKCSKCQLSQYCSLSCQKEDWSSHKFACSIVAEQRTSKGNCK